MDGIKRVSKRSATQSHASSVDHRRVQKSQTLNRKFVKKPAVKSSVGQAASGVMASIKQENMHPVRVQNVRAVGRTTGSMATSGAGRRMVERKKTVKLTPSDGAQVMPKRNNTVVRPVAKAQVQSVKVEAPKKRVTNEELASIRSQAVKQVRAIRGEQRGSVQAAASRVVANEQFAKIEKPEIAKVADARLRARKAPEPERMSPQELKDRAIRQALQKMAQAEEAEEQIAHKKRHFGQLRRVILMGAAAMMSVFALGYLVRLNLPDISVRVAASRAGMENVYPSFLPSGYALDGLAENENASVRLKFVNGEGKTFIIKEEKSSWDSTAVLTNYVKKNWGDDYSVARGQGLTIYVSGSKAVWVNGGVLYLVDGEAAELSTDELHDIAISL